MVGSFRRWKRASGACERERTEQDVSENMTDFLGSAVGSEAISCGRRQNFKMLLIREEVRT